MLSNGPAIGLQRLMQHPCTRRASAWIGAARVLGAPVLCLLGRQYAAVAALGTLQAVALGGLLVQVC